MTTKTDYSFETGIYRPPSEGGASSLLVRLTRNCPWNRCTFCSMYKEEKFKIRSVDEIKADIDHMAAVCDRLSEISVEMSYNGMINRKVVVRLIEENPILGNHLGIGMLINWFISGGKTAFLQDANSLIMRTGQLIEVLQYLKSKFPSLERITTYARSKTIAKKSAEDLIDIRKAGLDRLHVGLETGDDELLSLVKKGVTGEDHILAGRKAMEAGFQLSEYWMPGLGGQERWEQHALNTADVLNRINPNYARSRPFFPLPGTPIQQELETGNFQLLSPLDCLKEIRLTVENLTFHSKLCFDHAGNHWTDENGNNLFSLDYEGYQFPEQKQLVLERLDQGIEGLEEKLS